MRIIIFALAFSVVSSPAVAHQDQRSDDPFQPLAFLLGRWTGTSSGTPGEGTVEREYSRALNGRFIYVRNRSVYPPQARNAKGEVHEDVAYLSFDRARRAFVLRQFHIEGFVNEYVAQPPAGSQPWIFTSEAIENIPPGWRARETYTLRGPDEIEEVFELAEPGKDFAIYSRARLSRASESQADDVGELTGIQHRLAKAWVAADRATLEPLFAPDWQLTYPDGSRKTRAEVFGQVFETKVHRILSGTIDDIDVRMVGKDAAVVTGRTRGRGEVSGQPYDVTIRFTDVWQRHGGGWRAVASHASRIAATP